MVKHGEMCLYDRMRRVRYLCSLAMFDTCVGFFVVMFLLTRVRADIFLIISFDWRPKALVSNERYDCSAFHGTILAGHCRQACRHHVTDLYDRRSLVATMRCI